MASLPCSPSSSEKVRESSPTTHSHTHKLCSKKSKLNFQLTTSQNARRRNVSQLPLQILHLVPHTSCRIPRLIQPHPASRTLKFQLKKQSQFPRRPNSPRSVPSLVPATSTAASPSAFPFPFPLSSLPSSPLPVSGYHKSRTQWQT